MSRYLSCIFLGLPLLVVATALPGASHTFYHVLSDDLGMDQLNIGWEFLLPVSVLLMGALVSGSLYERERGQQSRFARSARRCCVAGGLIAFCVATVQLQTHYVRIGTQDLQLGWQAMAIASVASLGALLITLIRNDVFEQHPPKQ